MLKNPYLIALGIPIILIFCGAFAKKLVRGTKWKFSDFYLGVELALAAMASSMVYIFDVTKLPSTTIEEISSINSKLAYNASFLTICFFLLLFVLTTHQDWEKRNKNPKGQIIWLGIVTNLIGSTLMAIFVLIVKGVN